MAPYLAETRLHFRSFGVDHLGPICMGVRLGLRAFKRLSVSRYVSQRLEKSAVQTRAYFLVVNPVFLHTPVGCRLFSTVSVIVAS